MPTPIMHINQKVTVYSLKIFETLFLDFRWNWSMDHRISANHSHSPSPLWFGSKFWSSGTSSSKETQNSTLKRGCTQVVHLIHWTWLATPRKEPPCNWRRSSMPVLPWWDSSGSLSKQRPLERDRSTTGLHIWAIHFTPPSSTLSASFLKPLLVFGRSLDIYIYHFFVFLSLLLSCKVCNIWQNKRNNKLLLLSWSGV